MLRQTGVDPRKGLGRIAKAAVQAPMEMSMGITKGFHNAPKLWGDDTVRPQEKVTDLSSGLKAVGKEFGLGWYDGVTGVFTQPWKGAQKEGTIGFLKGIGKGIGGIVAKPGAALFGIPGHFMKGVHKEMQKLWSGNVQNYIIASRTAQGYEAWLQSSDAEKQDVIDRWRLIQKYLKKKRNPDEMVRDILEAQRMTNMEDKEAHQSSACAASYAQSVNSADAPTLDPESAIPAIGGSQSSEASLGASEINETIRPSFEKMSHADAEEDANVEQDTQQNVSQLQRQRQEAAHHQTNQENLRQAMARSEVEAQRNASEASECEKQLERVMAQSLSEQRQRGSDSAWESGLNLADDADDEFQRARRRPGKVTEKAPALAGDSSSFHRPLPHDPGHLAGTTQSEFEAQQQGQQGEKTTQERTEEEMVMEYVKKQSLLEVQHWIRNKGKSRAMAVEDEDNEELHRALELSMRRDEHDAEY